MANGTEILDTQPGIQVVTERNVAVPMRDGVVLRANVFRPNHGGPYPVLVLRTPYGKPSSGMDRYVKAGYIVVTQDARGRYASDGQYESFVRFDTHDAEDGYDTVEWAARLPGSSGKVGTFGASYNAFLQWRLAALRPPSLVAMAAYSIPARYLDLEGPGTIRPGRRLHWWFTTISPDLRLRAGRDGTHTTAAARELWNAGDAHKWLYYLPWLDLPREAFEDETSTVHDWLKNPHTDPWNLQAGVEDITVPNPANTPTGGGQLLWEQPTSAGIDEYTYDPHNPVPSLHGPGLQARATDQRPLAERQDILVYQTEV